MIVERESEIQYLRTCYEKDGSNILVVYGEKNVGKSALLKEFAKDKPHTCYRARSASEREQRYQWGGELGFSEKEGRYPSYTALLEKSLLKTGEKQVLIIDEFQLIVKAGNSFIQELIAFVRERSNMRSESGEKSGQALVVLCSSSIGWVENSMITKIGRAVYELSGFLKIRELGFDSLSSCFPEADIKKRIEFYAILGGAPGLWRYFDPSLSVRQNVCRTLLNREHALFDAGQRIVEEELRETGVYNTILASIASGRQKLNDLYAHTGFSRAKISVYLKNLMELELVEKVFSYDTDGRANARKGIYRIRNHFVHFYFAFIYPNKSALEGMEAEEFYGSFIEPSFNRFTEQYFKKACAGKLESWNGKGGLPFKARRFGEWVGKFGNIDLIARAENGKTLIGLCSWENPVMRYEDYEWLLFCAEKAGLSPDYIWLFSAGEFDERLKNESAIKENLKLIKMDDL